MKKVLITGIDSFTGKYLSLYLQNSGYDVFGTSLLTSGEKIFKCDITNKNDIESIFEKINPEFIIHLSGISFAAHEKTQDFYNVNTIGTTNILDILLKLNLKPTKIILASSATVYGNQGLEVLDESLCPQPHNHYGASKYAMECIVKNYYDKLNIIITRPFNYTGVGQAEHFLIPKIVSHYKENKKVIELGNLDVCREFNDINFVCEVYAKLLICDKNSEVVNICANKGIKLLDVISKMNKITNYEIEVKVNKDLIRKDEIKVLIGSNKKLQNIIGFVDNRDFFDTLKEMFES